MFLGKVQQARLIPDWLRNLIYRTSSMAEILNSAKTCLSVAICNNVVGR